MMTFIKIANAAHFINVVPKCSYRLHCSSTVNNGGGHLVVEDGGGNVSSIFLKDGFFDFLNKV